MASYNKVIDLLLIGKTGNGKSATGNSILKKKVFKSGASTAPITKQVQVHYGDFNERTIKVVDVPGLGDTDLTEQEAYREISNIMSLATVASPQGYHAFLIVVRYGGRFTKEDKQTVELLKTFFGDEFVRNFCVLVVTGGDNFRCDDTDSDSFEDWSSFQTGVFRDLIVECRHRVVLFDNRTEDADVKSKQLDRLLEIVDGLGSRGQRYADKHFEIGQGRIDLKKTTFRKESMKEARLIFQELEEIQLYEPGEQLKHLENLLKRADDLLETIAKQDNNTGVLREVIQNARHIKETVESQMSRTKRSLDIQTRKREVHEELVKLKQKYLLLLEEPERRTLIERIRKLEEEDRRHRETIEMIEANMRKDLRGVERECVEASEDSKGIVGSILLKYLMNAVFPSWVPNFLKSKKQS